MSRMEQKKEQKRNAILKAAREIFLSEGYVKAGMDKIADKARVTKQTVYRYFPSKEVLFEETLRSYKDRAGGKCFDQLCKPDTKDALYGFAVEFIQSHLSEEHLAIFRLLISESGKAPELTRRFFAVGPREMEGNLDAFFRDRFQMEETGHPICVWTGMLLTFRTRVLMGFDPPTRREIEAYAEKTTAFFLRSLPKCDQ